MWFPLWAVAAQPLEQTVRDRIAKFPGSVVIYARNLKTGASFGIRESEPVRTASTIKLPIMAAVFDAVAHGGAKWDELLTVTVADKVGGTGVIGTEMSDGVRLPLRDVLHLMIAVSDNTATNMILGRFTADALNRYLERIGLRTTRALRKMPPDGRPVELSAAGKLPQNRDYGLGVTTPREMVSILEKLERGQIVDPDASREMLAILKRCQDHTGIRRRLGAFQVAHKSGSNESYRADVGIVYTPAGPIALAIAVSGIPVVDMGPDNMGSLLIADLAKMLVEGLGATVPSSR
jgi:beta-lactamase class A